MSTTPDQREAGLFAAVRNVGATLLAMGQTRLELLGNEIETQKLLVFRTLLLAQAMVFCVGLSVLLLVLLLVVLAWEQRIWMVGALATLFVLAALGFYRALMRAIQTPEPMFAATLAELQEDIRKLKTTTGHADAAD